MRVRGGNQHVIDRDTRGLLRHGLARSSNSRGIIRLSATTIASFVVPSSSTSARANRRSWTVSAFRSRNPPLTITGSVVGVISTAAAPARNSLPGLSLSPASESAAKLCGKRSNNYNGSYPTARHCDVPLGHRTIVTESASPPTANVTKNTNPSAFPAMSQSKPSGQETPTSARSIAVLFRVIRVIRGSPCYSLSSSP